MACGAANTQPASEAPVAATPAAPRTFVIAEVGLDASKKVNRFQPLADHLAAALSAHGYTQGEVRIIANLDDLATQVRAGQIDMVVDSPYPAMIIADRSGALPILRRWKGGEAEYYSVIFAREDRGVATLDDLKGRYLAAENSTSTSGYFLPLAYLIEHGLQPLHREALGRTLAGREVGYVFTGDDDNTVQWVLAGKADAGAVDRKKYAALSAATRVGLVVLGETEHVARHIVLVRPDMDPALPAALKAELQQMDSTEGGRVVLEAFEKTTRFDDLPIAASLERMRALFVTVSPAAPNSGASPAAQTAR